MSHDDAHVEFFFLKQDMKGKVGQRSGNMLEQRLITLLAG